jgi:hypothetical protein
MAYPFEDSGFVSLFSDPLSYTFDDPDQSVGEQGLWTFGFAQT